MRRFSKVSFKIYFCLRSFPTFTESRFPGQQVELSLCIIKDTIALRWSSIFTFLFEVSLFSFSLSNLRCTPREDDMYLAYPYLDRLNDLSTFLRVFLCERFNPVITELWAARTFLSFGAFCSDIPADLSKRSACFTGVALFSPAGRGNLSVRCALFSKRHTFLCNLSFSSQSSAFFRFRDDTPRLIRFLEWSFLGLLKGNFTFQVKVPVPGSWRKKNVLSLHFICGEKILLFFNLEHIIILFFLLVYILFAIFAIKYSCTFY